MSRSEPLTVQMAGSEWFGSRAGGLNRYFSDLYDSLDASNAIAVSASAFGKPDFDRASAHSWGPLAGGLVDRHRRSKAPASEASPDILDRHFSVYGPSLRAFDPRPAHVVHFQGPWAAESAMAGEHMVAVRAKKILELTRYRTVDHFIVLSDAFKRLLADDYRVDEDRITVIPPGVDLARFELQNEPESDAPIVLCVRRLERRMGIHVLIAAWAGIIAQHPSARLKIVGTGTYERELRQLAADSTVGQSIEFKGRLSDDELQGAYREATLTVIPTIALEGFGLIALESLAAGRVPVVTDIGGLPDAVQGLDPSLVVRSGSLEELTDRVSRALGGERPSAQAARNHALSFSWARAAERHVALYERLVG